LQLAKLFAGFKFCKANFSRKNKLKIKDYSGKCGK